MPVSMMEAASFGIPIIATDVGGVCEIVEDGRNGMLLRERASAEEFAECIEKFYGLSRSEKNEYRDNSRMLWEEKFDASKAYADFFPVPSLSRY